MIASMELCTARGVANIPSSIQPKLLPPNGIHSFNRKTQFPFMLGQMRLRFHSELRYRINSSLLPTTSSERTLYGGDEPEPESEIIVEKTYIEEKKEGIDTQPNGSEEVSSVDNLKFLKFLEEFDIKFDYEETYSIIVLGGGSLVALWLAAAVVGAIDSIPLFRKVMELVGLGYAIWFSSRYLLFKENRDELVALLEQIKQEVLGSKDNRG